MNREARQSAVRAWSVSLMLGGFAALLMMMLTDFTPASDVIPVALFGAWVGSAVAIMLEPKRVRAPEHVDPATTAMYLSTRP